MPNLEPPSIPDRERDIARERKHFSDLEGHDGFQDENSSPDSEEPSDLGKDNK